MSSRDPLVHSFIVRLSLEEVTGAERTTVWRGQVTHVPGGESRYFRNFDDLVDFIRFHIGLVGRGRRGRLWQMLRRWLRLS